MDGLGQGCAADRVEGGLSTCSVDGPGKGSPADGVDIVEGGIIVWSLGILTRKKMV